MVRAHVLLGTGQEEQCVRMVSGSHCAPCFPGPEGEENASKVWSARLDNTAVGKMHTY